MAMNATRFYVVEVIDMADTHKPVWSVHLIGSGKVTGYFNEFETAVHWAGRLNASIPDQGADRRTVACINACAGIPTVELEYLSGPDPEKGVGLIRRQWDARAMRLERDQAREELAELKAGQP